MSEWHVIKPPEKGRTHMTSHRLTVGSLWITVMERHPIWGLCWCFLPFVDSVRCEAETLEDAKAEAIAGAKKALSETLNMLD